MGERRLCKADVRGSSPLVSTLALLLPLLLILAVACAPSAPLLSPLSADTTVVRPNAAALEHEARVGYTLGARADVSVDLVGPDGKTYPLRDRMTRAPDAYQIAFDGTVPAGDGRRVLPDGQYQLRVAAQNGVRQEQQSITMTVADADTTPVEIVGLQTDKTEFSPNGDGLDDDVRITYRLTKDAEATVYVTNEAGSYFAIDPWRKRRAAYQSHQWDGTTGGRVVGGKLLPDGKYTVHVEARDPAGNTSRATVPVTINGGGTPRLEIVDVHFAPIALLLGETMDVRITVKNTGTTPLKSWGPAPGFTYDAPDQTYASIRDPKQEGKPLFFEQPGRWRVGVTWDNAPQPFPLRWGLFPPGKNPDGSDDWDTRRLQPGESATVEGHIRVNIREDSRQVRFSVGVIQEGVGFPGGRVAEQVVQVGY